MNALTYLQRRLELFGCDAGDGITLPRCHLATCQRGGLFSGNSKSSQSTTDARIGVESGQVAQSGSAAQDSAIAMTSSNVSAGDGVTANQSTVTKDQGTSAYQSTVASQGGTLFQNVSGGIVIGDPQGVSVISEKWAQTVKDMTEAQTTDLQNILGAAGQAIATTAGLSESKLTDGGSTLSREVKWIALAGLALVAVLVSRD